MAILLEFPFSVVERADLSSLQPTRDAMEMERMVAHTPGYCTFLAGGRCLIRLALDAQVHNMISTNGAIVHHDVPSPQGYGAPLLHLKAFLSSCNLSGT